MQTEVNQDEDQDRQEELDDLKPAADAFHVHDDKTAAWVIRKIVEERAHRQRVEDWHLAELRRSERRERFLLHRFGGELEAWARQQLTQQHGNRRSIHLPSGTIGFRTEPLKVEVKDETTLVAWCREHLPSAIKTVKTFSILKSEIASHIKTSGECPDGAELAGGKDKFYIK